MSEQLSFLILEDHSLVLNALSDLLSKEYLGCQIDCFKSIQELQAGAKDFDHYDLMISDIQLEDTTSYDLMTEVKSTSKLPVLVVSMHNSYRTIIELQEIGVDGYILKDDAEFFQESIQEILSGNQYFSPKVQRTLNSVNAQAIRLSKRQLDVLKYWEKNFSNEKIAKNLFVSIETVKSHKRNIRLITGKHELGEVLEFLRSSKVI